MEIRYFSDLICPFCYIAEHSVMIKLKETHGVSFLWLGMELHPETPPAIQAGLDSGEALLALTVPTYQLRLDKRRYNALGLGVKTLPAFMWDKKLLLFTWALPTGIPAGKVLKTVKLLQDVS